MHNHSLAPETTGGERKDTSDGVVCQVRDASAQNVMRKARLRFCNQSEIYSTCLLVYTYL